MSPSVAILGGGVSGLTLAAALKERGYGRVVVFEREARVGGKSCTVDVDGRPHDLGATMGIAHDYRDVTRSSDAVGVKTVRFPQERHYSVARGTQVALNRWRELPAVLMQAARYMLLHATWKGVDGSGLHRAPALLHQPWSELVARHGLHAVNRRTLAYRTGYGYGFDDEIPALLYANLFRPRTFFHLARTPAIMWQGGTQPIWERLAKTLDVRVATPITRIERRADGVRLDSNGATEHFDRLVITINPKDALRILDATDEERGWFSQVESYPYATFACQIAGLDSGRASVGYLDENMARDRPGHPMAWVKRYPDQDVYVFHLFAPASLSDDQCAERIGADMARLGGRLVRVCASRRWQFFPHFRTRFLQSGGLQWIERWQGRTGAYLIGEVLSFATMARVAELARGMAARLAAESAGVQSGSRLASAEREVA